MIRLTLVRHARAEPGHAGGTDFDRLLDRRGLVEAADLGHRLVAASLVPDIVLASPAPRALHTAQIIARELRLPAANVQESPELYLAEPEVILERLRLVPARVSHLVLVGHNPGLTECARRLARDDSLPELPTAGLCSIVLNAAGWENVPEAMPDEVTCDPARIS